MNLRRRAGIKAFIGFTALLVVLAVVLSILVNRFSGLPDRTPTMDDPAEPSRSTLNPEGGR